MVTRSLTEVFVLMRNNAAHSRQVFSEHSWSERARLVDMERGGVELRGEALSPPPWLDSLEEAQYLMTRLRRKLEELKEAQVRHLQRPTLDEGGAEEQLVSRLTAELKRHLASAQRIVRDVSAHAARGKQIERQVARNVVTALVTALQDISLSFRDAQTRYLKSLTSREERSNAYFELPNFEELSLEEELLPGLTSSKETDDMFTFGASVSGLISKNTGFFEEEQIAEDVFQKPTLNQKQLLALQEENTKMAEEREQEVNNIVKSIFDLNDIFKDLGHMVQEQGTVLDRIDYNIEQTQMQVHEGYKQLQTADRYQRKNRKMHCILSLGATIVILIIVLILVKS